MVNMERQFEINDFLKDLFLYKTEHDCEITKEIVSSFLYTYGLSSEELNYTYTNIFPYFEKDFKDSKTKCFNDPRQKNYMQLRSRTRFNDNNYIKLYINVNPTYVYTVVKAVISFLNENGIDHNSQVSTSPRSDGFIVRVRNVSDAQALCDFINSDQSLVEVLRKPIPFMFRDGLVGISYDKNLSYISVLCDLVARYINSKENASEISYKDFCQFQRDTIYDIYSTKNNLEGLKELIASDEYKRPLGRIRLISKSYMEEDLLSNYLNLSNALALSTIENDVSKFYQLYNGFTNSEFQKKQVDSINDLLTLVKKDTINEKKELIDDYILYAYNRYQKADVVIKQLFQFMRGQYSAITRDQDFRTRLADLDQSDLKAITNPSIDGYVKTLLSKELNIASPEQKIDKYELFINACKATYKTHGIDQLRNAIELALNNRNYQAFTNQNGGYRRELIKYVTPEEITEFINETIEKNVKIRNTSVPLHEEFTNIFVALVMPNESMYKGLAA